MRIVLLDAPADVDDCAVWETVNRLGTVERHRSTTLPELLDRARTADVLISWEVPFRRAVLDYMTRPRAIVVPAGRVEVLVDGEAARQLGIRVITFDPSGNDPCGWIGSVLHSLEAIRRDAYGHE